MFNRLASYEKIALAIAAAGLLVAGACHARAIYIERQQIKLLAIDIHGEAFFAGVGSDCALAFKGATIPDDWRELVCVDSSSPLWAE